MLVLQGKHMRALSESVSFGRFLSESLAWEKWSSFSHNRYLEDVEKYSRPGSVAQKKAYFEAHYKKIAAKKAAALLEQEKESACNTLQPETQDEAHKNAALVSHLAESDGHEAVDESRQTTVPSMEEGFITDASRCNSNVEMDHMETNKVKVAAPAIENQVLEKISLVVEPSNKLADVGNHGILTEVEPSGTTHMDQTHTEENVAAVQKNLTSATKAKPLMSYSKPSAYSRESRLSPSPAKSTSIHSRKENIATPNNRKSARDSVQKKCSTPKSLHISINFSANHETLASATKTKPAFSSSKPPAYSRLSGLQSPTAKSTTPVHSREENNPTPNSKESARDPGNKKYSMPKSLHMSINFAANQETLPSATKTKPAVSSSKPSLYSRASRLPSSPRKSTTPLHSRKENCASPNNKKSACDLVNEKCSTPKSLHLSINFTPSGAGEPKKTSSVRQKTVESRRSGSLSTSGAVKTNKISVRQRIAESRRSESLSTSRHFPIPLRTPTMESMNGLPKNPSVTPQSEKRSTRKELDLTAFGSSKERSKWQSLSMVHSKSLSACGGITRSPTLSSPFSFRTDERAAKRKEKLENKYNAEEAQNVQLQMKSKEKAESELKKLQQSLGFKAKPMPDFYRETESGKNQIKKISLTHLRPPKLGRKPISNAVQDQSSLPPRRPAVKNDNT
ncbi:protein WVD2-like 7 isoform X2 [Macadamia integrifolia]|uniref:protein WVD2-like 7 isoform X2 n=1 Tax=Macadamia integrifolia TaxID=60698 RepID=UPI001C5021E2|nr:protein WVD2-like 7 isoform X2 [Macadamia integrifolia]